MAKAREEQDESQQLATRDITTRALTVRSASINEADRSVEAVVATETRAQVFDWSNWEIIEEVLLADGFRSGEQVPLLETHQTYSLDNVLGSARGLKRSGKTVVGRLMFAEGDDTAERAWQKVRQGHLTDVSIGYRIGDGAIRCDPGEKISINGKTYKAGKLPLRVVPDWEIKEVSLVPIGADEAAKIRSAAGGEAGHGRTMMAKTKDDGTRSAPEPEAPPIEATEPQAHEEEIREKPAQRAAPKPRQTKPPAEEATEPDPAAIRKAVAADRKRQQDIRNLGGEDIPADLVQRAIDEDWSLEQAGLQFREYSRKSRSPAIQVTDAVQQECRHAMALSMCHHAGMRLNDTEMAAARSFCGLSFRQYAEECLDRAGVRGRFPVDELWHRSISTSHLPNILGEAANRILHQQYESAPSTFRRISVPRGVPDFKTQNDIKIAWGTTPETVGPGGKIPLGYLTDSKETYKLTSKGLAISVAFEQFVNDDLGAFLRLPAELVQGMVLKEDDAFYDLLCSASGLGPTMGEDSQTMFYASRTTPNYYAHSTDSSINMAGLKKAKELMAKITDPSGRALNLTPRFLLCPPELEVDARMWTGNAPLGYTTPTSGSAAYVPTQNVFSGLAEVLSEARLSAKTNGTTAWYLIPDPGMLPIFIRGYLQSVGPTPRLSTYQMQGYDNLVWQILGYSCPGIIDWRCIRMKGAA